MRSKDMKIPQKEQTNFRTEMLKNCDDAIKSSTALVEERTAEKKRLFKEEALQEDLEGIDIKILNIFEKALDNIDIDRSRIEISIRGTDISMQEIISFLDKMELKDTFCSHGVEPLVISTDKEKVKLNSARSSKKSEIFKTKPYYLYFQPEMLNSSDGEATYRNSIPSEIRATKTLLDNDFSITIALDNESIDTTLLRANKDIKEDIQRYQGGYFIAYSKIDKDKPISAE